MISRRAAIVAAAAGLVRPLPAQPVPTVAYGPVTAVGPVVHRVYWGGELVWEHGKAVPR